jgi:uncharacterized membrane protein required for colicin V production
MVDVLVLIILAGFLFWGYEKGVLSAAMTLAAMVAAAIVSYHLAPGVAGYLTGLEPTVRYPVARVGSLLVAWVSLRISGRVIARRYGRTERGEVRLWNRRIGGLAGLISGLTVVLILLSVLDTYVQVAPDVEGRLAVWARGSFLRRATHPFNPLNKPPMDVLVPLAIQARKDPAVIQRVTEDERVRQIREHPAIQAVLQDQDLMAALREGRVEEFIRNEKVRKVWDDPDLRQMLRSDELRQAIQDACAEPEEDAPGEAVE